MRLGTQTASMTNYLMSGHVGTQTASMTNYLMSGHVGAPKPEVGMGCTILMWTDRHAATIVEVNASGKTIKIQQDNVVRTDKNGMSENQTYAYTPNTDAPIRVFRLGKRGWHELKGTTGLRIGDRSEYHDFSF